MEHKKETLDGDGGSREQTHITVGKFTPEKAGLKKKELNYQIIPHGEQEMADLRVLVDTVSQVTPKTDKDRSASEAA